MIMESEIVSENESEELLGETKDDENKQETLKVQDDQENEVK